MWPIRIVLHTNECHCTKSYHALIIAAICVTISIIELAGIKNVSTTLNTGEEIPFYKEKADRRTKYLESRPRHAPDRGTKEYEFLENFRLRIEVILQTVNENEYQAATTVLEKPGDMFERAVVFPKGGMVVGIFAKKRVALIQTDVGVNAFDFIDDAIKTFPNAFYVIGVGVCYSFDKEKYKLGDVLVSEQISNLDNMKWDEEGRVEDRGQRVHVVHDLHRMFCGDLVQDPEFKVSQSRSSEVYSGTIISYSTLINNKEIRDKFHAEVRTAIGGEMEGGQLLRFERKRNIKGIIAIKGICDYAERKLKIGSSYPHWQLFIIQSQNYCLNNTSLMKVRAKV